MRIRQVAPAPFPHGGLPVAVAAVEPDDLTARQGVQFENGADDLGEYRFAAFALSETEQAWLLKHRDAPYAGMLVIADAAGIPSRVQRQVVEALALGADQLTWALVDEDRGDPRGFY